MRTMMVSAIIMRLAPAPIMAQAMAMDTMEATADIVGRMPDLKRICILGVSPCRILQNGFCRMYTNLRGGRKTYVD